MVGLYKPDGQPHIDINMDRETITTPDGRRVAGFKGSKANVRAKFTDLGEGNVKINIEYDLNLNRIFVRGLYKIGFEFLALVHGAARCYDSKFDQIRGFVRHDLGERLAVAVAVPETEYSIELFHCEPDHPAPERTALRVGALVFMMDLTQGSTLIKEFAEEAQRRNPEWWKLIPE